MKQNLISQWTKLVLVFIVGCIHFSAFSRTVKPEDLTPPKFDKTHFIVDPERAIVKEWKDEMISSRETYFFCRYIEPVCVRVDNISSPSDIDGFADKLVKIWDLENKSSGRFVFQLVVNDQEKIVYRFGKKIAPYYEKSFLKKLKADLEEIHFGEGASGTGSFVSLQKLGDNIFYKIAFDAEISTYEGNDGIHKSYPEEIEEADGKTLSIASYSHYYEGKNKSADAIYDELVNSTTHEDRPYFTPLSQIDVDKNFSGINSEGKITKISQVPNNRTKNNSRVSDPHHLLSSTSIEIIDSILVRIEEETTNEVAVVCLNSIGDNPDVRTWGTDLFNEWGIGKKDKDNGLLILLVHDQHAIEFITGRGMESILTDAECVSIQEEEMIPYFKQDDYVTGMIRGIQAVEDVMLGNPPDFLTNSSSNYDYDYEDDYAYDDEYDYSSSTPFFSADNEALIFYLTISFIFGGINLLLLLIAFFVKDLHKRYHTLKLFTLLIFPIVFPLPMLLLFFVNRTFMNRWRNTERISSNGEFMHKLGEKEDDAHLESGQVSEEKVKSIDYDVWVNSDKSEVLVLAYKKWFSKYNKCPSCKYKTYFKLYDKTITAATYTSSGTGERCYKCENCGHQKITTYTIPKKTKSSSSSGGYSSGSSGGYSSSSSSGSSWGGGSSRSGGGGSRW